MNININDLTIGQAKELAAMLGGGDENLSSAHIGKKCIIRTYASGVHFGELVSLSGRQVELKNARRLWRWDVTPHGVTLSEVAMYGSTGPETKISCAVPVTLIVDVLEVTPCTEESIEVIEGAKVYKNEVI